MWRVCVRVVVLLVEFCRDGLVLIYNGSGTCKTKRELGKGVLDLPTRFISSFVIFVLSQDSLCLV